MTDFVLEQTSGVAVTQTDAILDLKRVAQLLAKDTVSYREYLQHGKYTSTTLSRKFGTWNKALAVAGLSISNAVNLGEFELFGNIEALWRHFGRQPTKRQLSEPPSVFSEGPYARAFGSWRKALEAFVKWANSDEPAIIEQGHGSSELSNRRTPRDPDLRLRYRVMKRDNFTCKYCGKSPATTLGVELELDHKHAWSKGGETTFDNLITACTKCNRGKSNL